MKHVQHDAHRFTSLGSVAEKARRQPSGEGHHPACSMHAWNMHGGACYKAAGTGQFALARANRRDHMRGITAMQLGAVMGVFALCEGLVDVHVHKRQLLTSIRSRHK